MHSQEKIARILRVDKDVIFNLEKRLAEITGKQNIFEKILEENEAVVSDRLRVLGLPRNTSAKEIFNALTKKIEADNAHLYKVLGSPDLTVSSGCGVIIEAARKVSGEKRGFFIKKEKAIELLIKNPPEKIISAVGASSIDELLQKEDWIEIFCALRFLEDKDWLNDVFFKEYKKLTPNDFEERAVELRVLGDKWTAAAEAFVKKKYHNISHLKELGVVFMIHKCLGVPGELIRNFTLLMHYLNEIPFYSEILKNSTKNPEIFSNDLVSLLRGDVLDNHLPESEKTQWLVIQRYLAKDDENDWRLFFPHINPEAIHWKKAETALVQAGNILNHFGAELAFWQNLDWVGDYFMTDAEVEVLVSFNLIDTAMSLVKEKELIKYLYHHEESMWNKIFIEYFSEVELEKMAKENLLKGFFEI